MNSLDQGKYWLGALSIQPKIPVISVGTSNGTDHFGLFRPEYSGPALKVVHRDRSGHFGRSDRKKSVWNQATIVWKSVRISVLFVWNLSTIFN